MIKNLLIHRGTIEYQDKTICAVIGLMMILIRLRCGRLHEPIQLSNYLDC